MKKKISLQKLGNELFKKEDEIIRSIKFARTKGFKVALVAGVFDLGHAAQAFFFNEIRKKLHKDTLLIISLGTRGYAYSRGLRYPIQSLNERAGNVVCISRNKIIGIVRHKDLDTLLKILVDFKPDYYILSFATGDLKEVRRKIFPVAQRINVKVLLIKKYIDSHASKIIERIKRG